MRPSALLPIVFIATALVLTFLCLFAGSNKGFLEEYSILTLNTSRIGYLKALSVADSSDNALVKLADSATKSLQSELTNVINSAARELGLHDFYSAHLMSYCEGYYTPSPIPNATLKRSSIHRSVTNCSNGTAMWNFDPQKILQRELDDSGHGDLDLVSDLNWPKDISRGIRALRYAARAAFVLYCIAIAFEGVALLLSMVSIFFEGRVNAFMNVLLDCLAFMAVGIASAIATAIAVKGTDVINKYGDDIGIQAQQGNKFITLTWVATGLMLVASMVWCCDCIVGSRKRGRAMPKG